MTAKRRGWMTLDALAGLFLLAALATLLAVAANMRLRTARAASAQRASLAVAQRVLSDLQSGREVRRDDGAKISIDHTGQRVGDLEWVQVTVVRNGHRISLMGPARAPTEGGP